MFLIHLEEQKLIDKSKKKSRIRALIDNPTDIKQIYVEGIIYTNIPDSSHNVKNLFFAHNDHGTSQRFTFSGMKNGLFHGFKKQSRFMFQNGFWNHDYEIH